MRIAEIHLYQVDLPLNGTVYRTSESVDHPVTLDESTENLGEVLRAISLGCATGSASRSPAWAVRAVRAVRAVGRSGRSGRSGRHGDRPRRP